MNPRSDLDPQDTDRLALLDRLADRVPELDLEQHEVEWLTLPDGAEALIVDGGGLDGGSGIYFANAGEAVHAVGSLNPIVPGCVGCVVIEPDGTRRLAPRGARPVGEAQLTESMPADVWKRPPRTSFLSAAS